MDVDGVRAIQRLESWLDCFELSQGLRYAFIRRQHLRNQGRVEIDVIGICVEQVN